MYVSPFRSADRVCGLAIKDTRRFLSVSDSIDEGQSVFSSTVVPKVMNATRLPRLIRRSSAMMSRTALRNASKSVTLLPALSLTIVDFDSMLPDTSMRKMKLTGFSAARAEDAVPSNKKSTNESRSAAQKDLRIGHEKNNFIELLPFPRLRAGRHPCDLLPS